MGCDGCEVSGYGVWSVKCRVWDGGVEWGLEIVGCVYFVCVCVWVCE